ncbi:MAG TPA: hypothetical protein VGQ25_09610 [Gemmatimonadales bacterium]|nr:hypothetical protein [Gemmatimonadales bacterium]
MRGLAGGVAALVVATAAPAQRLPADSGPHSPPSLPAPPRPASVIVRPLASLLVPGTGQLMGRQDRGAVYLAAELYLLSAFLRVDHEARRDAERFEALAYDVARRPFSPTRRDTVFEYYEQMERFAESGRYDTDPGSDFAPESDLRTYNGSVWLLARRTLWPNPDVPPGPELYWRAVEFYKARAVAPGFQWSWRDHPLEHMVFRETIRKSDDGFRRAQAQVGLLLANHVASAVDALISSRLAAAAGRPAEIRTTLTPGRADLRFSVAF